MRHVRTVHVLGAKPLSFYPCEGQSLTEDGLSLQRAIYLCQHRNVVSHIRNRELAARASDLLRTSIPVSNVDAPSPFAGRGMDSFLLVLIDHRTKKLSFVELIDTSEEF